jgi:hypothetical protein
MKVISDEGIKIRTFARTTVQTSRCLGFNWSTESFHR